MSTGFTTDVIWVNAKVYSVTSEPTQTTSSFKHSSALLNNSVVNVSDVILIASTLLAVKTENIYRNTRKMHTTIETDLSL